MRIRYKYLIRLGENIRSLRAAASMTQEELACISGLHRTYIGGIERGERNITVENVLRLAGALSVSCAALVAGLSPLDLENKNESNKS